MSRSEPPANSRGHVSLHRLRAAQLRRMVRQSQLCDSGRFGVGQLHCECLDRSCDVLQFESAKFGKCKIKPAMQMVADRAHGYATRQALGLKPRRHIHGVAVQVCAVRYRVTDVDTDTKSNGLIWCSIASVRRNPPESSLHSARHRRCYQTPQARSRRRSERSPGVFLYGRINHFSTEAA